MIKIQKVKPFDSFKRVLLSELAEKYYQHVTSYLINGLTNIATIHGDEAANLAHYLLYEEEDELKRFVLAEPNELQSIIEDAALAARFPNIWHYHPVIPNPLTRASIDREKKKLLKAFNWDSFRGSPNLGLWLASQLNIQACPYCNAQYTTFVDHTSRISRNRVTKAKFDFDHFYPKTTFPFFTLSFYNLIPSCASCNRGKSFGYTPLAEAYHPYHNDLDEKARFHSFYVSFKPVYNLTDSDINIKFLPRKTADRDFVNNHNENYDIEAIYGRHKGYVKDLLLRKTVYNKILVKDLAALEKVFNNDKSMVTEYIIGTKTKRLEILDRPLVKLHRDVAIHEGMLKG